MGSNVSLCPVQPSNITGYAIGKKQPNVGHFGGISSWPAQNGKTFQSSYAEVFKNRRGIFEQGTLFDSRIHKTLDDLNLVVPRVTSFTKESKSITKPKGSRVQFEEIQGKNENCHIANHYGKRVSDDSEAVNSDHTSKHSSKLTNKTQNTEIINPDTCHAPFWSPLARSRTAPNLVSSHGTKLTSPRNKFEENGLLSQNEIQKVSTIDDSNEISNVMEDSKDNVLLPKVPARKLSSHKSVVQLKKSKFEADDKDKCNTTESDQNMSLNKSKMAKLNKDMKRNHLFENDSGDDGDDMNNSLNWRPLRDFF